MTDNESLAIENFSHLCVGVSDMDRSLAFYTGLLGMDVVFDVYLDGSGLDAVTGRSGQKGRMVGGLIGGAMVELLALGAVPGNRSASRGRNDGRDLTLAYQTCAVSFSSHWTSPK